MMFFRLAQAVLRPLIYLYFLLRVGGRENFPKSGPYIIVGNHRKLIDPVVAAIVCHRAVRFLAKAELFDIPVLRRVLLWIRVIPLKRGSADVRAIREALNTLKGGGVVGLFPEGTRVKDEVLELTAIKGGVALIALKAGVDVVPLYNAGPYRVFSRMRVRVGRPVSLAKFAGRKLDAAAIDEASEMIRQGLIEAREAV